jgi:phosphoesterase RecJ-like protein
MSLTEDELNRYKYQKGDTDGLVNVALSLEGIQVAAFFAEKDGQVKISFRSKGDYFVNVLAGDNFAGGGHKYAAGGISFDPIQKTIDRFKSLIPEYFK